MKKKILLASAVLFASVVLVYSPSVNFDFLTHDDFEYVYQNERVLGGLTRANVMWGATNLYYASNWHPITWWSWQAESSVVASLKPNFELKDLSRLMHLDQVVLHGVNTVLLFVILLMMLNQIGSRCDTWTDVFLPLLFVAIWSIHPLRTEAVCWISERKLLVCCLMMLISFICWVRTRTVCSYLCALLSYLISLMAKAEPVSFPLALFAWDWLVCNKTFRKSVFSILPFFIASGVVCYITMVSEVAALDVGAGSGYSFFDKLVFCVSAPVIYLRQTIMPFGLSAFYPTNPPIPWPEFLIGCVLVVMMLGVSILCLVRRERWSAIICFGIAWAYGALLPVLGIVKVGDQSHSDRYTYCSGCALIVVVCLLFRKLFAGREKAIINLLLLILMASTLMTLDRMKVWRDSKSLYLDAAPKSWAEQPVCALATIYCNERNEKSLAKAEELLRSALTLHNYREVRALFSFVLALRSTASGFNLDNAEDPAFAEAKFEAMSVLAHDANHPLANESMGIVLMKSGKYKEALKYLEVAAKGPDKLRVEAEISDCREKVRLTAD